MLYLKYLRRNITLIMRFYMKLHAIIPLTSNSTIWSKFFSILYALLYCTGMFYLLFYQLILRLVYGQVRKSQKATFSGVISTSMLFSANILASLTVIVLKPKRYSHMMTKINNLKNISSRYFADNNNTKSIGISIILLHLWYGLVTHNDIALFKSGWLVTIHSYVYDSQMRYRWLIQNIYMCVLVQEVYGVLRSFNDLLKAWIKDRNVLELNQEILQDFCKIFVEYNEIVLSFNDVFGGILFLSLLNYFYIILTLSTSITSLIAGYKVHWAYPTNVAMLLTYATVPYSVTPYI